MELFPQNDETEPRIWVLIRDVAVLQLKLLVDGLRDFVLVPASLIAGIVSLVKTEDGKPGPQFYRLIGVGKQSEEWINLFGALRNAPSGVAEESPFGSSDIDEFVSRVENFVVEEYRRGGVTTQAKARIDKALSAIRRGRKNPEEPS